MTITELISYLNELDNKDTTEVLIESSCGEYSPQAINRLSKDYYSTSVVLYTQ